MPALRTLPLIASLLCQQTPFAQPAIGQWRDHSSALNTISVVEGNGTAYCATRNGIFSFEPSSGELTRINKVNLLNDVDVSALGWSDELDALVVGYGNGNLDLVFGSSSVNLSDIRRSSIIGDKRIYDIRCEGDLAYLCCGFGIVVMDMVRKEVKDTWFIFPNAAQNRVNAITFHQDSIYAATEMGLFSAWKQDPNLAAFTNWHQRMDLPLPNGFFSEVESFDDRLFVNWTLPPPSVAETDTIYFWDAGWQRLTDANGRDTRGIAVSPDGQRLVVGQAYEVRQYNTALSRIFQTYGAEGQPLFVNKVAGASSGGIWTATRTLGLARCDQDGGFLAVAPNGPENSGAVKLDVQNGLLMVATGSVAGNWANTFSRAGLNLFEQGVWRTVTDADDPLMLGVNSYGSSVIDNMAVAVDPENEGHAFTGSWDEGVLEWRNGAVESIWNASNSSLGAFGNPADGVVQVAGLDYDQEGNLWVSNANTQNIISVQKKDGTWKAFNPGTVLGGNELVAEITAMENGQKWLVRPRTNGIVVFTDGGSIDDTGDDQWKLLTTFENQGKLPTLDIFAITEDQDGEVWVGTGKGIAVFYNPEAIFSDENFDCQQILIEQDGNVQILLETEVVSSIVVDGGNRKWLGTQSSGAFLVSPDGTEQLLHFTQENSPLPSNNITSIAIDGVTGEVFIGTDQGIVSYRGDATEGANEATCATVFPNPVRETYQGSVAINGLVADSDVRITDMAGNLVYRTVSNGGQAMWPTTDLSGQRVASGVYLVLASDPTGTAHCNTKVMVVR